MKVMEYKYWSSFTQWAKENGYDESYLNYKDSKCLDLYESFLLEYWEIEACNPNQ